MKTLRNLIIIIVAFYLLSAIFFNLPSCSLTNFARQDMNNIRAMFHVPPGAVVMNFSSFPKQAGWFGREGLLIYAVFQLNEQDFADYLKLIKDPNVWKPVPFKGRSPEIEKKFTPQSCEWRPLPLSANVWGSEYDRKFHLKAEMEQVREGFYYCTVSHSCYERPPIYAKRYSCEESSGLSDRPKEAKYGSSRTIGVLDTQNRRLIVEYRL